MILANVIKSLICLINLVKSINVLNIIRINRSIPNLMKFSWDMSEYSTRQYYNSVNHSSIHLSQNICQLSSLPKFGVEIIASGKIKSIFNDPDIPKQWYYVKNKSIRGLSHELDRLWVKNITGKGVTIGIISHGFQADHDDIRDNYNPQLSYNFIESSPHVYSSDRGRMIGCAGLISAVANNNKCGVGAAPSSKVSILQIYDDLFPFQDIKILAKAISYQNNLINIYVIPLVFQTYPDIILDVGKPGILALENGHKFGRNKLGCIYLSASGVSRLKGNNCAFNGYNQRPEIYVIGSLTKLGSVFEHSEMCTAVVASVINAKTVKYKDLLYSTIPNNKCDNSERGLVPSSGISAGIVTLLLSYNPSLTARQIMILMIEASTQYDTYSVVNSAGFLYSTALGFGMLNASKMIEYSDLDRIKYIPDQHICTTYFFKMNLIIPVNSHRTVYIYTTGCVKPEHCVTHIEQVFLVFTLKTVMRRSVSMYLISPSGTRLNIIEPRRYDTSHDGFDNWSLKILGFYSEKPHGIWRLQIFSEEFASLFKNVKLKLYGICDDPMYNKLFHNRRRNLIWGNRYMDTPDSLVKIETRYIWESSNSDEIDIYSCVRYFCDQKK